MKVRYETTNKLSSGTVTFDLGPSSRSLKLLVKYFENGGTTRKDKSVHG